MKIRRTIAAVLAVCLVGGALQGTTVPVRVYAADTSAVQDDYTTVTDGDIEYCVYSDHAAVHKCSNQAEGDINIKASVDGQPVTEMMSNGFYCCSKLTSITLPDTLTTIGYGAFTGCNGLTSFTVPSGVKELGADAFSSCSNIVSIELPDTLEKINTRIFAYCSALKSVTFPEKITSIFAI